MDIATTMCLAIISLGWANSETACEYADNVIQSAEDNDIDPLILFSLIHVESRWNPRARSNVGACGLTQVIPRFSETDYTCRDLMRNPEISISVGASVLARWINGYGRGRLSKGLCGYNAGYQCTQSRRGRRYARRIIEFSNQIRARMQMIQQRMNSGDEELINDMIGC